MMADSLSRWMVGEYEDDHAQAFIGVEGGSICWVDDLTKKQAGALVRAHNQLLDDAGALDLKKELIAVMDVAIARGEKLGYADEDYRKRIAELRPIREGGRG